MKQVILLCVAVFGIIGSYVPMLFGDHGILSGWSILGSTIGGFIGIWIGVKLYRLMN